VNLQSLDVRRRSQKQAIPLKTLVDPDSDHPHLTAVSAISWYPETKQIIGVSFLSCLFIKRDLPSLRGTDVRQSPPVIQLDADNGWYLG